MSLPQALVPEHLQRPWGLLEAAQSHAARGGWAAVDPARAPAAEPCRKVLVGSAGGDRSFRRVLARLVGFASAAVSNRVGASLAPPPAPPSACGSRTRAVRSAFPDAAAGVEEALQAHGPAPVGVW